MVSERFRQWLDDPVTQVTVENSPHRLEMVRRTQDVIFDTGRCTSPGECLKCLKACGPHVLALMQPGNRTTPDRMYPARIICFMPEMCSLCNRCVEVCPKQAVSIKVNAQR